MLPVAVLSGNYRFGQMRDRSICGRETTLLYLGSTNDARAEATVTQLATAVAGIQVRILGPLQVSVDGAEVEIRGRRPRTLLAVLALAAGQPVSVDGLIGRLWNDTDLPSNPRASLQTYVLRVRQALGREAISTASGQYTLNVAPDQVDVHRFSRLLNATDQPAAGSALDEALELWRGTPFDEPLSDWLTEQAAPPLIEAYLGALEQRAERDLATGRPAESLGELQEQAARFPLRESLWATLLTALAASGRPAEALDAYDAIRRRLADELGVDPSLRLQQIHADLLAGTDSPRPAGARRAVPQQLPADPRAFTGRSDALARLDALAALGHQDAAPVMVVHGPGGIGKTTLAIRWARQVRDQYPDGQLLIDLRGFSPSPPMTSEQALSVLLGGLGITADQIPADLEAASALWRTTLAGCRALVVLDNARDAQQVRPLLPGPESAVVITSRSQLRGLVARDGATQIALDRLDPAESAEFLRVRLAAQSVSLPATHLGELAELCEGHPLALAIAAERCGRLPTGALDRMLAELRGEAARLDALDNGEDPASDLRAVFSWSYRALDEDSARVFRLIGLHPGGGISLPAVAALAGITDAEADRLVDRLVEANLLRSMGSGRFVLLDLLHEYAAEQAATTLSAGERGRAIRRLVSWYLHSVVNANIALTGRDPGLVTVGDPDPEVVPRSFDDDNDALTWLDTEWAALALVVSLAADAGEHVAAYRLVIKLFSYLLHRRPPSEAVELQTVAVDAADRAGAAADAAFLRNQRGTSWARLGEAERARRDFTDALEVFSRLDHLGGREMTINNLAQLLASLGRYDEALSWFELGLDLAEAAGTGNLATALMAVTDTYRRMGRDTDAVQTADRAVALTAEHGSADQHAYALSLLGAAEAALGRYADAETHLRQALDHQRPAGTSAAAVALRRLGSVALRTGRPGLARESWRDALAIIDETGILDATELSRAELVEDLARLALGRT